jgi:anti-sigma-K factor RskA
VNCAEFKEQVLSYAIGALDARERRSVEAHLDSPIVHEGCVEALHDANEAASVLALALARERPSAGMWKAIERRLDGAARARTRSPFALVGWLVAAVALVLIIWLTYDRYQIIARLRAADAELQRASAQIRVEHEALALLDRPSSRLVALPPTGKAAGDFSASVILGPDKGYVVATGLTPQPEKDYELWLIRGGKPIPAGLLRGGGAGPVAYAIDPALLEGGPVDTVAITIERAGGVPQPEGPIILAGKI